MSYRENIKGLVRSFFGGLRPDEIVDLPTWAAEHMESPMFEGGRWNADRTPYAIEPMKALSLDHPADLVVFMAGTQTFKTAAGLCWLAYVVYYGAGPFMHVRPKIDAVREFIQERINPVFDMDCLDGKVARPKNRNAVARYREFNGGFFFGCGTMSASDASAKTVRFGWQDETDREAPTCGKEGPMSRLFPHRLARYGATGKLLQSSSPTTKDGPIWKMWESSSQGEFEVPCPSCGHYHVLTWPHVRWTGDPRGDDNSFDVWMECPSCHGRIDVWQKTAMMAAGRWVHRYPDRATPGFHLSSLYSPVGWRSWKSMARDFVVASDALELGDAGPMQVFVNTDLAEAYEHVGQAEVHVNTLMTRREHWEEDKIPAGVLLLTCGVDTQDDRLEAHVIGWGRNLERWTIDYAVIEGGPIPDSEGFYDWDYLDDFLDRTYQTEDGRTLPISFTCVDLLGHRTSAAFTYTRRKSAHSVIGIMGKYGERPVVERRARKDEKRAGAKYRLVGTDSATADTYASLRTQPRKGAVAGDPWPNYWHFPDRAWVTEDWFKQLTSEHAVHDTDKHGVDTVIWVQHQKRNEVLDTSKYAYAALKVLEMEGRLHDIICAVVPQKERDRRSRIVRQQVNRPASVPYDQGAEDAIEGDAVPPERPAPPDQPYRPNYGDHHGRFDPRRD